MSSSRLVAGESIRSIWVFDFKTNTRAQRIRDRKVERKKSLQTIFRYLALLDDSRRRPRDYSVNTQSAARACCTGYTLEQRMRGIRDYLNTHYEPPLPLSQITLSYSCSPFILRSRLNLFYTVSVKLERIQLKRTIAKRYSIWQPQFGSNC